MRITFMSPLFTVIVAVVYSFESGCAFVHSWLPSLPSLARNRPVVSLSVAKETSSGLSGRRAVPEFASGALATRPDRPIVVIGAGGKTGRIITQILAGKSLHVRAVTRSGSGPKGTTAAASSKYVSYAVGDVTRYDSIQEILRDGAAGVVFAATSSGLKGGGGGVADVDYMGAYNVARACIASNVPKFVLISAACATRPNALGAQLVNKITELSKWYGDCSWMDAKAAGEATVRDLYRASAKNLSYTIVRMAAALVDKPPVDVGDLLVLQGDVYSSAESISRTNVAQVVVAALLMGKATDGMTFEICPAKRLYRNDNANLLDVLSLPSLKQTRYPELPPKLVHRDCQSYAALLHNLVTDEEMAQSYGSIVSSYRGEGSVQLMPQEFPGDGSFIF